MAGANRKCHVHYFLHIRKARARQFCRANSTSVSAPIELICHQFLFHHPNCFLQTEIGPISSSRTFHYDQELNTWRPPAQLFAHISGQGFFSLPSKRDYYFFSQLSKSCVFTITAPVMISIRANQSQSRCSPLKVSY